MANIWVRKPMAVLQAEASEGEFGSVPGEPGLRRTLSLGSLLALGIGAVIGAGIFVLTGHAAAHAGPAVSLSFVLAGVVCAFAGLCYAEMASTVPVAGSAYTYAYATMGEFIAWIIGWDLILEYAFRRDNRRDWLVRLCYELLERPWRGDPRQICLRPARL
jgi:APA family basic amino acid/polyamine antiporter